METFDISESLSPVSGGSEVWKGNLRITTDNMHDYETWMKHPGELVVKPVRVLNPKSRNGLRFDKVMNTIAEFHQERAVGMAHEDAYSNGKPWAERMGSLRNGRVVYDPQGDAVGVDAEWHINEFPVDRALQAVRDVISHPKNIKFSIEIDKKDWSGRPVKESESGSGYVDVLTVSRMKDTAIVCFGGNTNSIVEKEGENHMSDQIKTEADLIETYGDIVERIVDRKVETAERRLRDSLEAKRKDVKECCDACSGQKTQHAQEIQTLEDARTELQSKLDQADEQLNALKSQVEETERRDYARSKAEELNLTISEKRLARLSKFSTEEMDEEFAELMEDQKKITEAEQLAGKVQENLKGNVFGGLPNASNTDGGENRDEDLPPAYGTVGRFSSLS